MGIHGCRYRFNTPVSVIVQTEEPLWFPRYPVSGWTERVGYKGRGPGRRTVSPLQVTRCRLTYVRTYILTLTLTPTLPTGCVRPGVPVDSGLRYCLSPDSLCKPSPLIDSVVQETPPDLNASGVRTGLSVSPLSNSRYVDGLPCPYPLSSVYLTHSV